MRAQRARARRNATFLTSPPLDPPTCTGIALFDTGAPERYALLFFGHHWIAGVDRDQRSMKPLLTQRRLDGVFKIVIAP